MALETLPYLKIGYKHLGRGWVAGDCFNLVLLFYEREFGIVVPDFAPYSEEWAQQGNNYFITEHAARGFYLLNPDTPLKFGDALLFTSNKRIAHVGIILDPSNGYFIHTTKSGTAVHNYLVGEWSAKRAGVLRHKELVCENTVYP